MATESLVFDILARDGASPSFAKVGLAAEKASGNLKDLSDKLKDVSGRTANARVGLKGDKEAQHELDTLEARLARLGKKVATGRIDLAGVARARAEISGVDLALDRLDHKHVEVTVDVDRSALSRLSGLFGGGTFGGPLGGPLGIGGIAGGGLIGAGLIPGIAGLGLGALGGGALLGGGLFGAETGKKVITADQTLIKQITAAEKTALGKRRQELHQSLVEANKQLAKDMAFFAPFQDVQGALKDLLRTFLVPLRPIMEPLAQLIGQFGKGLAQLGPQFTAFFRASLPFLEQFAQVMLQSGKILLPAFTDALNQMVKSGALKIMTDSLVVLVRGLGQFIEALGPGMKASAEIFARLMTFLARALPIIGKVFSAVANLIMSDWSPGHLWNILLSSAKAFWHAVVDSFHAFTHAMASSFDAFRHDIASIWDTIWRNTVSRVANGIRDVRNWFDSLPGSVRRALAGLGSMLRGLAAGSLNQFWSGFKSVAGSVIDWVKNLASKILGALNSIFHFGSPSKTMFKLGQNIMLGLLHGLKSKTAEVQRQWGGAINFGGLALGGDAALNQRIARRMFPWGPSQWPPFVNLVMAESGFNRFARNPSSGAYGIPQALPESKLPFAGQSAGGSHAGAQLAWMFQYIAGRYGTPANAWAHETAFHWYDSPGRFLPKGPSLIWNGTGYPEQVVPGRSGAGGQRVVVEFRSGPGEVDQFLTRIMERIVRTQGGGDVQAAFGTSY